MAQEKTMTVEEIDKHLHSHLQKMNLPLNASVDQLKAIKVCDTYIAAKPILIYAKGLLSFFKPAWGTALGGLIAGMDVMCPPKEPA